MFLLDDILLAPARGLMAVFRSLHDAAQDELAHEAESIRNQLSEMYVLLETGRMSEEEFDRGERELLERLERLDDRGDEYGEQEDDEDASTDADEDQDNEDDDEDYDEDEEDDDDFEEDEEDEEDEDFEEDEEDEAEDFDVDPMEA